MARYYFHIYNGHGETRDDEGVEMEEAVHARGMAVDSIRSIVADEARSGLIDLSGHIDVEDQHGDVVFTTEFKEAFNLRLA
jgi:hypothetical protein